MSDHDIFRLLSMWDAANLTTPNELGWSATRMRTFLTLAHEAGLITIKETP